MGRLTLVTASFGRPGPITRPSSATALPASAEIGQRIEQARKAARLLQRDVWTAVGVSKSSYVGWITGKAGITAERLPKLVEILKTTEDWLAMGDEIDDIRPGSPRFPSGSMAMFTRIEAALDVQAVQIMEMRAQIDGLEEMLLVLTRRTAQMLAQELAEEDPDDAG